MSADQNLELVNARIEYLQQKLKEIEDEQEYFEDMLDEATQEKANILYEIETM